MPHVALKGNLSAEDIWLAFSPEEFSEKGNHFKAEEAYLSTDKKTLLIKSIVVERGFSKTFLVKIAEKEERIVITVDPICKVEKSEGVKRLIGLYAWRILQAEPESKVDATNIEDLIGEPKS